MVGNWKSQKELRFRSEVSTGEIGLRVFRVDVIIARSKGVGLIAQREMCMVKRRDLQKTSEMFPFEGWEEKGAGAMETEKEQ